MVKLKVRDIDGEKYVELRNRMYKFEEEFRGVREKFWLIQAKGKYFKEPLVQTNILFKYNRNDVSCENWGEIYASRIAKQIAIPCVEYHLATFEEDGKITPGVLCGTYKKNEKEIEATAYDAQTMFDERVENINTVDSIMENIMEIVPENKDRNFYYKFLRNSLIKQCIFDFLLAQTDRHWFNTTFLLYTNGDIFNIRKADCYDNGCIAFLKRKYSAILGITTEIKSQGKNSQRLHDLLKYYVPMTGIKTSTVEINSNKEDKTKLRVIKSRRDVFLDELTNEILNNPEIASFYSRVKRKLNVQEATRLMQFEKMEPPEAVSDMVELVVGYQFNVLNELIREKIKKSRMEETLEVNQ